MGEENVVSEIKREYITNLLSKGKRIDGRKPEEYRKISVRKSMLGMAEGSARVQLGNTDVIAGIKVILGEPYPDSKDKGVMTTMVELTPLASPDFENGPPRPNAIEISRVVDRGIRESDSIKLTELKVPDEDKCFVVFLDIYPLDMDGNLIDASTIALVTALKNTIVPAKELTKELDHPMEDFKLPLVHTPVAVTGVKIGDKLIIDPTQEEEDIAGARLTVTVNENGEIVAMQKGNIGRLTSDDIDYFVDKSIEIGDKIRKLNIAEGTPEASE